MLRRAHCIALIALALPLIGGASGDGILRAQSFAQSPAPEPAQSPERYTGDIRQSDPRAAEILAALREGTQPPTELRLRYSGTRGDYLAFYDIEGRDIMYRYREDRFDRRAEKRIQDLIAGQAYRVSGR